MWKFRMLLSATCFANAASLLVAQTPPEPSHSDVVKQIREEGLDRSKIMETISHLTDVHGPRLTGSAESKVAGDWTVEKLKEWGLQNAHLEQWGPFGRGWSLEGSSISLVEPTYSSLIAYPKAWSPSTPKTIRGEPIYLDVSTAADLDKYRGKLGKAIVLISPPRELKALFEAPAARQTTEQLLTLANADLNSQRQRGGPGGGPPTGRIPGAQAEGTPASGQPAPGAAAPPSTPAEQPPSQRPSGADTRTSFTLQADKWQLAYDEGAAVVLEPGRGDGGTVFVASATMPRIADGGRGSESGNPFSRGPRPWAVDAPEILPQAVLAAEHYNRIVRMIQRGAHPKLEIDIASKFYVEDQNTFNIVAEIPGSDLKDEIVMLGAHFDSWHSGTGATDNAVGCGVALEAVRILNAIGAKPRRTIRIGLWTGEEQGLLGSRAYVAEHFGKQNMPARGGFGGREGGGRFGGGGDGSRRPRATYELKPEHEKISAYFNLDNGTGKVRGVYLQGNEQVRSIFRTWLSPFADMGASTLTSSNTGGTDHLSFDGIGIPGFQFIQDPIEYDTRTHHSSMDTYERIQEEDVKQAAIIMATFVYQTSMRDEKLPRKPLDGEVVSPAASQPAAAAVPVLPAIPAVPTATVPN